MNGSMFGSHACSDSHLEIGRQYEHAKALQLRDPNLPCSRLVFTGRTGPVLPGLPSSKICSLLIPFLNLRFTLFTPILNCEIVTAHLSRLQKTTEYHTGTSYIELLQTWSCDMQMCMVPSFETHFADLQIQPVHAVYVKPTASRSLAIDDIQLCIDVVCGTRHNHFVS